MLDIAWLIYANRLSLGGYPFAGLHPRVTKWMENLRVRPEFAKEIAMPPWERLTRLEATRRSQVEAGEHIRGRAGFSGTSHHGNCIVLCRSSGPSEGLRF